MPYKYCPKCQKRYHTRVKDCVCGYQFYTTNTNSDSERGTSMNVHFDPKTVVQECMPIGFQYLGKQEFLDCNGCSIADSQFYAYHPKWDDGKPFSEPTLSMLIAKCYRISYGIKIDKNGNVVKDHKNQLV